MSLDKIESLFSEQNALKDQQATAKRHENIITGIKPATHGFGPRYFLANQGDKEFLRMNSNSYLGLENHPALIDAEEKTVESFGTGPGA